MGYYLAADLEDPQPLASNVGWGDFTRWVASLPREGFDTLRHLCREGWTGKAKALAAELGAGLKAHAPTRADVQETAAGLATLLEKAGSAEVVTVTDGLGPGD